MCKVGLQRPLNFTTRKKSFAYYLQFSSFSQHVCIPQAFVNYGFNAKCGARGFGKAHGDRGLCLV